MWCSRGIVRNTAGAEGTNDIIAVRGVKKEVKSEEERMREKRFYLGRVL